MQLMLTLLLIVTLSAVLSKAAVLQPNYQKQSFGTSASPILGKKILQAKAACVLSFPQFKEKYNKKYTTIAQQNYREQIFYTNLRKLNEHNNNPNRTYNMKPNSFLDINTLQFKSLYTNTYQSNSYSRNVSTEIINQENEKIDSRNNSCLEGSNSSHEAYQNSTDSSNISMNISQKQDFIKNISFSKSERRLQILQIQSKREINILESVHNIQVTSQKITKNIQSVFTTNITIDWTLYSGNIRFQGLCGACYAFSTVDTIAAINAIQRFGSFLPLSVQQIIDCVNNGLTFGCHGGYLQGAYTYIQMKGATTEFNYPYISAVSGTSQKCKFEGGPFRISSFSPINEGDCEAVISELKNGPVSAGISGYNLQFYDEGIFNECDQILDHAVSIIGYKSGVGWKIKNSWGKDWGEAGYGWIAQGNTCGICNMAVAVRL